MILSYKLFTFIKNQSTRNDQTKALLRYKSEELFVISLTIGCCIHLLWTKLFISFGAYQWHFVAYIPSIIYYLAQIIYRSTYKYSKNIILITAILTTLLINVFIFIDKGHHHSDRYKAAQWTKNNIDKNDSIALSDAGVFGYFNDRRTINLDGLINSYQFQQDIANGQLEFILKKNNIKYFASAYSLYHEEQTKILIRAWRGKNIKSPIGYAVKASSKDALYSGRPKLNRTISNRKVICFRIWKIEDVIIEKI
jgi:hypothetical protein